ncbi:MAG: hypothetical protein ABSG67_05490 [Thermoguttaceae bacterium]|jgi:hypothetical protein
MNVKMAFICIAVAAILALGAPFAEAGGPGVRVGIGIGIPLGGPVYHPYPYYYPRPYPYPYPYSYPYYYSPYPYGYYPAPAPVYAAPPPTYVQPAPVYAQPGQAPQQYYYPNPSASANPSQSSSPMYQSGPQIAPPAPGNPALQPGYTPPSTQQNYYKPEVMPTPSAQPISSGT